MRGGGEPPPPWEDGRASGHPVRAGEGSTTRWRTAEQGGADAGGGERERREGGERVGREREREEGGADVDLCGGPRRRSTPVRGVLDLK